MAVAPLPFREGIFVRDVRDRTQADHGMFVGSDGNFPYVCSDPAVYLICVFQPARQADTRAGADH
jgi:hypothetical protein